MLLAHKCGSELPTNAMRDEIASGWTRDGKKTVTNLGFRMMDVEAVLEAVPRPGRGRGPGQKKV